jgi:hypothetical protein
MSPAPAIAQPNSSPKKAFGLTTVWIGALVAPE